MRLALTGVLFSLLVLGGASSARAQIAHLNWDECSNGGVKVRSFACNTNAGSNTLVGTFEAGSVINGMFGFTAEITVHSPDATLPSWWHLFNGGSCRLFSLTSDLDPGASCLEYWYGYATGGMTSYQVGFGGANRARLTLQASMDPIWAFPINPGEEIYLFRLHLDNTRTVGTCAGCSSPAALFISDLRLSTQSGGLITILPQFPQSFASWQCSLAGGTPEVYFDCPTPALPQTWGSIKALYR